MIFTIKKTSVTAHIILVIFILTFSFSSQLLAQEQFLDEMGTINSPSLFVDKIEIPSSTETGQTIYGSFTLFNVGKQTADSVSHRVHLITMINNQGDLYPQEMIASSEMSETYAISSGQLVKQFTLQIPSTIPEEEFFGVYVEIFINNQPVTYEHEPLSILGNKIEFLDVEGMVYVGSEEFFLLEGPTIKETEAPELRVKVGSERAHTTIIPTVSIYKGTTVTQNPVRQLISPTFSIGANSTKEETYQIPTDLGSGVYTVEVLYTNQQGDALSPLLVARYVIAGLEPIIQNISYNDLNQNLIEQFIVSVLYADEPLNARVDSSGNFVDSRAEYVFVRPGVEPFETIGYPLPDTMSVVVKLTDAQTGKVIDEQTMRNVPSNPVEVSFSPIHSTSDVIVNVSLLEDGEVVDVYESNVAIIPLEKDGIPFFDLFKNNMGLLLTSLLGIAAIVVGGKMISFYVRRRKLNNSKVK